MNEHQIDATRPRKTLRSAVPMAVAPAIVALLATLTMGLALPDLSEAAFHPDAQNCRLGFGKKAEKFARTVQNVIYKCHKARRDGKIPASVDCTDMDQDGADITHIDITRLIERGESILRGVPGKRCGGVLPHHMGLETCPVSEIDCPAAPYQDINVVNTTNDLYKCLVCLVLSQVPQMMQDSLGDDGPIVAKACSGGGADGQACLRNNDCGGGSCDDVPVCAGGVSDGAPCNSDNDCGAGTCGIFDPTTDGKCHHTIAKIQARHAKTFLFQHAKCRRKDEKLGGVAPVDWCMAETCVDHEQSCRKAKNCTTDAIPDERAWSCIDKRCHAACTVTDSGTIEGCGDGESCVAGACRRDCDTADNHCVGGTADGAQCFGNEDCGGGGDCINDADCDGGTALCVDNSDLKRNLPKSRRRALGSVRFKCQKADLNRVPTCADPYVCVDGDNPGTACDGGDCGEGGTCEPNYGGIAQCVLDGAEAANTELFARFYPPIECGDGGLDSSEECDDGPYDLNNEDGCNWDCTVPRCGDGFIQKDDMQCAHCNNVLVRGCESEGQRKDWRCGYCLNPSCKGKGKCEKLAFEGGCQSQWVGYRDYSGAAKVCVAGGVVQTGSMTCSGGDVPGLACTVDDDCVGTLPTLAGRCDASCSADSECPVGACLSTMCDAGPSQFGSCTASSDCGQCDTTGDGVADGGACGQNSDCGAVGTCLEAGTCINVLDYDASFCLWQGNETSVSRCEGGLHDEEVCNPDLDCCNGLTSAGGCKPNSGFCGDDNICVGGKNDGNACDPSADCYQGTCNDATVGLVCEECDWSDLFNSQVPNQCRTDCQLYHCGDGVVDPKNRENCDDGNTVDDDDCKNNCTVAGCGNGEVNLDYEECDDGNSVNNDLCTAECKYNVCGDGIVCSDPSCGNALEGCDDGNGQSWDGCSWDCKEETCFVGDTCTSDSQCMTGDLPFSCVDGNCAVYWPCPANQTAVYGEAPYVDIPGCVCGSGDPSDPDRFMMAAGDACSSASDCPVGTCVSGVCQNCVDIDECSASVDASAYKGNGDSCTENGDCLAGKCREDDEGDMTCQTCAEDSMPDWRTDGCINLNGSYSCATKCTADAFHDALEACGYENEKYDERSITFDCSGQDLDGDGATTILLPENAPVQNPDKEDGVLTQEWGPGDIRKIFQQPGPCRDDFLIDGRGHNITFELTDTATPPTYHTNSSGACKAFAAAAGGQYVTSHGCTEIEDGSGFLKIQGDRNTISNLTVRGFFEGVMVIGTDNTLDGMTFDAQCDDSVTTGYKYDAGRGVGNTYSNMVVKNGCDKCTQLYGGDTSALSPGTGTCPMNNARPYSAVFDNVQLIDCSKPIRGVMRGGNFLVKNSTITETSGAEGCHATSTLSSLTTGAEPPFVIEFRDSLIEGCVTGILISGNTQAIFNGNTIRNNDKVGVMIRKSGIASFENNTIQNNGGQVGASGKPGYGGVAIDPVSSGESPQVDLGGGEIVIGGVTRSSAGGNTLCDNYDHTGAGSGNLQIDNGYGGPSVSALYNDWCGQTPAVRGSVLVE
ncbi:MAG: right-handed parallel beta-helix repeat-containing protein [Deltaproteobacteria bacterium]